MFFRQLFDKESYTYTYVIADPETNDAVFIDPVDTQLDAYLELLQQNNFTLKYCLETHVHADHVTASGLLREKLGCQTAVGKQCGAVSADFQIEEGDEFTFGQSETIKVIATPGHTPGSMSFLWRDRVFTGDALFIDGCGRTDFQGGDSGALYDAITTRLFTLPGDTIVYPGHDYKGRWISNIMQERTLNSRLAGKSREEFIEIMANLNLPKPKLIDMAVPANRYCGIDEEKAMQMADKNDGTPQAASHPAGSPSDLVAMARQNITEIDIQHAQQLIGENGIKMIDVREPEEFNQGHIDNAIHIPRGVLEFKITNFPELADKSETYLVYCRSGSRSALATENLQKLGYTHVLSLAGGYQAWSQAN